MSVMHVLQNLADDRACIKFQAIEGICYNPRQCNQDYSASATMSLTTSRHGALANTSLDDRGSPTPVKKGVHLTNRGKPTPDGINKLKWNTTRWENKSLESRQGGIMERLPLEVLHVIVDKLEERDVQSLNLCSRKLKHRTDPRVYRHLYIDWSDLEHFTSLPGNAYARHIHIKQNVQGEWQYGPLLERACNKPLCVQALSVVCAGCSGWLKYTGNLKIRELSLKCVNKKTDYFDFDNIFSTLTCLKRLRLENFMIMCGSEPIKSLEAVHLVNCNWEYPDEICSVGPLKVLCIELNGYMHPFAFSERLRNETSHFPDTLESLQVLLSVDFLVGWSPLRNGKKGLKRLQLDGFDHAIVKSVYNKFLTE